MRVGIGYDIHRLIPTDEKSFIPVGGVPIPCDFRVEAHSDGDALLHALTDAALGAMALGDMGQWFSDRAEENRGRPSADFVKAVVAEIHRMGWQVNQIDSIIVLERPRIAPHFDAIRLQIARLLQVELPCVGVKAKSSEGLGLIGERKAIAAHAVVTLQERNTKNVTSGY